MKNRNYLFNIYQLRKRYFLFVLFIIKMIQASAQTTYIHMGTAIDLLNGITVTWNGQGSADSIKWGYTPSFEMEQFRVDCGLKGQGKNLTDQQAHEILEFLRANDKDTTSRFH